MGASHQAIADAVAKGMYAKDAAAQALGITLLEIRPGYARMAMPVRPPRWRSCAVAVSTSPARGAARKVMAQCCATVAWLPELQA